MSETSYIRIEYENHVWFVPLSAVATHRAHYYADRDSDTTFQDEFDYVMEDDFEGIDWFQNNMDWSDVEAYARLIETPPILAEPVMGEAQSSIVKLADATNKDPSP